MALLLPAHMAVGNTQQEKPSRKAQVIGAGDRHNRRVACLRRVNLSFLTLLSSGNHAPGQSVVWTGSLGARQRVLGVAINWRAGYFLHVDVMKILVACAGRTDLVNSR